MKTNTRLKTFRLAIKVKPTPLHPMFNEVEFAMLFAYVSYNDEQIVKTVTDESTAEMVLQMLRHSHLSLVPPVAAVQTLLVPILPLQVV